MGMQGVSWGALEGPNKVRKHAVSDVRVGDGAHTHRFHTCLPWPLPTLQNLPESPDLSLSRGLLGALRGVDGGASEGPNRAGECNVTDAWMGEVLHMSRACIC